MVRRNIAATSLKILWKNLYLVKCYDKLNMNVLTLSLWENFWWGLIYFYQFIYIATSPNFQEGRENEKFILSDKVVHISLSFSIYCLALAFEHYRQVYIVHSGLQDESLQVTISKLP